MRDPLIALAETIDWTIFDEDFKRYYTLDNGRPGKPIRLMVGLLLLKQIEDLSDESMVLQWKRNPCYQYFCGFDELQISLPCHETELVKFRQRIGKEGMEKIFNMSVSLHGKAAVDNRASKTRSKKVETDKRSPSI